MPIDRSRYPKNWDQIALQIKEKAQWRCEKCGKFCLMPDFHYSGLSRSVRAKFTLTVHHQDYDPSNNKPSNLIALCAPCHLAKHINRKSSISPGQLSLKL